MNEDMRSDTRKTYAPMSPPREFHNESAGRLPSSDEEES